MVFAILLKPKSPKCFEFSFRNASSLFLEGAQPRKSDHCPTLNQHFYFILVVNFCHLANPKKFQFDSYKGFCDFISLPP